MLRLKTFGGLALVAAGGAPAGAATQRRRLALLAVLAAAGERGISREKLVGLFWPDSEEERGRAALAQALYALRKDLGLEELVLGTADVRLNPAALGADIYEYDQAVAAGRLADAARLYVGPFLDGFVLPDLDTFDRWLEQERTRRHAEQGRLLEKLADQATAAGDLAQAVDWSRALAAHDPLSGRAAVRLMRALAATGDRSGALGFAKVHAALVKAELEAEPDGEVVVVEAEIRGGRSGGQAAGGQGGRSGGQAAGGQEERADRPSPDRPTASADRPTASADRPTASADRPTASADRRTGVSQPTGFGRRATDFHEDAGPTGLTAEYGVPVPPDRPPPDRLTASADRLTASADRPSPDRPSASPWYRLLDTPLRGVPAARRPRGARIPRLGWAVIGVLAGAMLAAIAVGVVRVTRRGTGDAEGRVVAVGLISDLRGEAPALPVGEMLATNLARVPGLAVLSSARIYELYQAGVTDSAAAMLRAARQAGATELIDGALFRRPGGTLRLELRRTDLASGRLLATERVEGSDAFDVVERATAAFAGRGDVPTGLADVTTRSVTAYRFYEEGLRNFNAGNRDAARRLFAASIAEDTAFAMAHYWSAVAAQPDLAAFAAGIRRAIALADRATERERLLIRLEWALVMEEPSRLAIAESLVTRYPSEPDHHLRWGYALVQAGRFAEAAAAFERAIRLEPVPYATNALGRCLSCEARSAQIDAWFHADSFPEAERLARQWTRDAPGVRWAWRALATTMMNLDRIPEALAAERSVELLQPEEARDAYRSLILLKGGEFAEGERIFRERLERSDPGLAQNATWWLAISRRLQGRAGEGLAFARRGRAYVPAGPRGALPVVALGEGAALLDLGEPRAAAAIFDSVTRFADTVWAPSRLARHRAWTVALLATALAAAGDTARLAELADTVEAYGRKSAFVRDQRLHHHVRALLLEARGRGDEAIAAYERSVWSRVGGFTRANWAIARLHLAAGRPEAAIPWLRAAGRGPLEAGPLYLNQTDVHALLAEAFDRAGQPDSARVHFAEAARRWSDPEPYAAERAAAVRRWLEAHPLPARK